ncbi:Peroxisomal N(1)-acetyl-spermine/spermidine oxidase [Sarcoptes scabiei]|uniref:Peroxisomal N(1)-acetyl-spermine/spermidine oxidase n=1 Tax=Sarcoptes scabiei TaxID=52283 RepID=A0A131ZT13_SARSC|nr:Peroxisomal N(1)-acetyl-spermine/spermidine oxidase [Sarcoptes scabiei]KPL97329.1 peroxisomal N(1)-acetyl-spermine/spermidine oxidase-like protein 1 [Sarcoptes scabiei]
MQFDLLVIGGGVSGLSTVYHLLKQQSTIKDQNSKRIKTICLLEAKNRLGGRIQTSRTKIDEEKIEIGANWIHGIIDNPVFEFLTRNKIIDTTIESNKSNYNIEARSSTGEVIDDELVYKVYEVYSRMLNNAARFHNDLSRLDEINFFSDSMGNYLHGEIEKYILSENITIRPLIRKLFDSLLKRETCISGCDSMNDVSLQYFSQYKEYLGGNVIIPKGYHSLITSMLNEIDDLDCDIGKNKKSFQYFLQSEVIKIEWPGLDRSQIPSNSNVILTKFPLKIQCKNGFSFEANHVVLTIPLGSLQKNLANLFSPPLPQYKLECVQRMGFDVVDKIFLEYSHKSTIVDKFFRNGKKIDEIMLLWTDDDTEYCSKKFWYKKIYSIYCISDHCLQLWVSGKEARHMEQLDDREVNEQLTKELRSIFGDSNFPLADNVIVTRWGSDPCTLGSYSYIRQHSTVDDIDKLAEPIYLHPDDDLPLIVFGGEATHRDYFSTVHGAFLSGRSCASKFTAM